MAHRDTGRVQTGGLKGEHLVCELGQDRQQCHQGGAETREPFVEPTFLRDVGEQGLREVGEGDEHRPIVAMMGEVGEDGEGEDFGVADLASWVLGDLVGFEQVVGDVVY